ncbi:DNA-directed RNA polymerase sigma-70 factor [Sulfurimicrobium lacus]|uniref:DNA-directed RNA polymerase sigma-70 factor n=1 Tax=Sulfurimicrobium lacus TaxID=2715678 RepID=A0A6F8VA53_9PROT|nr:RNA polymerase sigma factor [Sulfurimicrobium lacus]BCB26021.1 DNA-directed RNA polymerase sigma-70 factor [Sulfurimicrobium lacus]
MKIISLICRSYEFRKQLEQSRTKLYRVAYSWCHDAALSDDLVQETLSKALKNAGQLRDHEQLNSWLFRILNNCWHDHFRAHREMEDIDEIEDHRCANPYTPEDAHAQNQIVNRVRSAVSRLPLGQRQVLTLVDLEEFSYAEVAEILALPAGTVMSRLCRARRTLKDLLQELAPPQPAQVTPLRRVK